MRSASPGPAQDAAIRTQVLVSTALVALAPVATWAALADAPRESASNAVWLLVAWLVTVWTAHLHRRVAPPSDAAALLARSLATRCLLAASITCLLAVPAISEGERSEAWRASIAFARLSSGAVLVWHVALLFALRRSATRPGGRHGP